MGEESGFKFVSDNKALKGEKFVISRQEFLDLFLNKGFGCIEFVSLQDLKGSLYFGGHYDKLREVAYTGEFYIFKDKNEQYQFKLYNKQHRLVLAGEVYNSKDRVISVINSIKRFAEKAQFVENQPVSE